MGVQWYDGLDRGCYGFIIKPECDKVKSQRQEEDIVTLLYTDPLFLQHQTGAHPERPLRVATIDAQLHETGLAARCTRPTWDPATTEQLARIHEPRYLDVLRHFAADGGGRIEVDTVVSPQSYNVALAAAGAVCDAVARVVAGEDNSALCLVRPPGHHALPTGAMGFCLLNNIAVAAQAALTEQRLDRVLIVDWDVHHGNGTQDAFWEEEQVGFFSIHRWPFYPGTGDSSETGSGKGLGATCNLPIAFGTSRREYLAVFAKELEAFAAKVRPQLVLVSAGFDAHREDPIGSLDLEVEDFAELTRLVRQVADEHCGGKLVSVLEGGYHPERLAESVGAHLTELLRNG